MENTTQNNLLLTILIAIVVVLSFSVFYKTQVIREVTVDVLELYYTPPELKNYREPGFSNTLIPEKSPFGGNGFKNTEVTAWYLDRSYFHQFGQRHYALDIIPSEDYYENNRAYSITGRPIIFAAHNGTVKYFYDAAGANYLVITNPTKNVRTFYVHIEASYVNTGTSVVAGQPIGIMGSTGNSTGSHLHYAIQMKDSNGNWRYVNPTNFIF